MDDRVLGQRGQRTERVAPTRQAVEVEAAVVRSQFAPGVKEAERATGHAPGGQAVIEESGADPDQITVDSFGRVVAGQLCDQVSV